MLPDAQPTAASGIGTTPQHSYSLRSRPSVPRPAAAPAPGPAPRPVHSPRTFAVTIAKSNSRCAEHFLLAARNVPPGALAEWGHPCHPGIAINDRILLVADLCACDPADSAKLKGYKPGVGKVDFASEAHVVEGIVEEAWEVCDPGEGDVFGGWWRHRYRFHVEGNGHRTIPVATGNAGLRDAVAGSKIGGGMPRMVVVL
ncbi:hypothetical protein DFJ74DRAFT_707324 [Hyaloraphidium curvatum]|nr:hypothetical protein DFJ74DRAFT_707324 [Hyaloraphidium curvatum]